MKKMLVLGATGLLGKSFLKFQNSNYDVVTHGFSGVADYRLDLRNRSLIKKMIAEVNPSVVINMVAITDVDKCESSPLLAYQVNVETAMSLVETLVDLKSKAHVIHISTDHVYNGIVNKESNVSLVNYYSFSKYCAELVISKLPSTVLRTNFFGKSLAYNRKSFTDWIYDNLTHGIEILGIEDVFFNAIHMSTLIENISLLADIRPLGIYNLGARDGISKLEFIQQFTSALGFPVSSIIPVKQNLMKNLIAKRPQNMVMNIKKYETDISTPMPLVLDEIHKAVRDYKFGPVTQ